MAGDSDYERDIRVKTPATIDCNNEQEILVVASALAIKGLMSERRTS